MALVTHTLRIECSDQDELDRCITRLDNGNLSEDDRVVDGLVVTVVFAPETQEVD